MNLNNLIFFCLNFSLIFSTFVINLNSSPIASIICDFFHDDEQRNLQILIFNKSTLTIDEIIGRLYSKIVDRSLEIKLLDENSMWQSNSTIIMINSFENFQKVLEKSKGKFSIDSKVFIFCELALINDIKRFPTLRNYLK